MRGPRRTFAAPFVVTIASAGACSSSPPPQQPPQPTPEPVVEPAPVDPPPPTQQVATTQWTVFKQGKECMAGMKVDCPQGEPGKPVPTCNPPPPVKYDCQGLVFDRPIQIARYGDDPECYTVPEMPSCPAGAACNPPPPQKVACPTR